MEPMKPMAPMRPMTPAEPWWPKEFGAPASAGAQNDVRYAFFPEKRRLLIERNGKRETYDTGEHRISGVSQQNPDAHLRFASQNGDVDVEELATAIDA